MFVKLLVFSCLVFINVEANPVRSCEDGEEFWCSSVKTAKQCEAFDHCLTEVWAKQEVKTGCMSGQRAVQQIQNQAVETACDVLPSIYREQCTEVIQSESEEIAKMTAAELHPRHIAKLFGLCSTMKEPKICSDCKTFANDLNTLVMGGFLHQQTEQYFRNLCGNFGSLEDACENITLDWVNNLFKAIQYRTPFGMVCEWAKFCEDEADRDKSHPMKLQAIKLFYGLYLESPSVKSCRACKALVKHSKKILERQDLQQVTEDFLSEGCTVFPQGLEPDCVHIAKEIVQLIFQLADTEISETAICEFVDMCEAPEEKPSILSWLENRVAKYATSALNDYLDNLKTYLTALEEEMQTKMNESNENLVQGKETQKKERRERANRYLLETSGMVKAGADSLQEKLLSIDADLKGIQDFISALNEEMSKYLVPFNNYVNGEIKKIYEEFKNIFDNYKNKKQQTMAINSLTSFKALLSPQPSVNDKVFSSGTCRMCAMLTKEMLGMLSSDKTQQNILATVDEFCDHLPDPLGAECRHLVRTEGPTLLRELLDILSPTLVCEAMGFCDDYKKYEDFSNRLVQLTSYVSTTAMKAMQLYQDHHVVAANQEEAPWCRICHIIVEIVDDDVDDIRESSGLVVFSHDFCGLFGSSYDKQECFSRIRSFETLFFQVFKIIWTPQWACTSIGVCERQDFNTVLTFKPEN